MAFFRLFAHPKACLLSLTLAALPGLVGAKGISVRFLASPAEDSVVRYEVYRSDTSGGPAKLVGAVAATGKDTLGFRDLEAEKGRPYVYSIKGIDALGGVSDPSEQTEVGFPLLALPDTLGPDRTSGITRMVLAPLADPLRGKEPLSLSLVDSSRFSLGYDPVTRSAEFRLRGDKADSGWVIVRAQYFGKFEDRDSIYLRVSPVATTSLPGLHAVSPAAPDGSARFSFPVRYSPLSQGPVDLENASGSAANGPASLEILTLLGAKARVLASPGGGFRLTFDGRDRTGRILRPARYLWTARNASGTVFESGSFLVVP